MKFCTHCGSQVSDTESFCKNCGAPVPNANGGQVQPNQGQQFQQNQQFQQGQMYQTSAPMVQPKSKLLAGLLGIFLGSLGVHNFYLGYTGKAIAQLLMSILSCGLLAIVSYIWGLIEGIMILSGSINTDAKGNMLGE